MSGASYASLVLENLQFLLLSAVVNRLFKKKKDFIYFLERREGRERNTNVQEKHQLAASGTPLTRGLACNPAVCPDRESNQ